MKKKLLPIALELTGIAFIGAGIALEMAFKADIYLIVITTGSCLVAMGGVIWGKFMRRE